MCQAKNITILNAEWGLTMTKLCTTFFASLILIVYSFPAVATSVSSITVIDTTKIYGVTLDAVDRLGDISTALRSHSKKMTARIVFDEWIPAADYLIPIKRIRKVSNIMGELLDSYYFTQYSYQEYVDRVNEYLNTLGTGIDIWEIGNEVNGEWLGNSDSVVAKIYKAYQVVKSKQQKTALTLYYNYNCWSNPDNEMFLWVNNKLPLKMRLGVDYLLVSYYEDDCNNYQPNWQTVFDSLHVLFPNSKLGIGECGTIITSKKAEYITRYYTMNITTPNYVGGYFWWYYKEDCVPYTKPLWQVLEKAISSGSGYYYDSKIHGLNLNAHPNPFNPQTEIDFELTKSSDIDLKIFDVTGREVITLSSGVHSPGNYNVSFDGTDLASGIYYCRLEASGEINVQKLVLLK
jgi:hypothetical protein